MYKKRIADDILNRKLKTFGGTLIVGPKGCGKTTTAKQKESCLKKLTLNVVNTLKLKEIRFL